MARATTTSKAARFDFSKVHTCRIHPGIGIARVGNSPDGYFIGPEAPCDPRDVTPPLGGYKDAEGRVKRQGARFRIYAYDKKGNNLGELPIQGSDDPPNARKAIVEWHVHLSNKKGAWFKFPKDAGVRNGYIRVKPGQSPDDRKPLVIDPGPRSISGQGIAKPNRYFDTGRFRNTEVPLGELRVDEAGRLIVFGGFGKSASTEPDNPIGANPKQDDYWANNDYWYDDVSDGSVSATVTLPPRTDGTSARRIAIRNPKHAAWVIVAPPKFAPGIYPVVTLYEVVREVALDQDWEWIDRPAGKVNYQRDIYPILLRAAETAWVANEARRGHGYDKRGDFRKWKPGRKLKLDAKLLSSLGAVPPAESAVERAIIFARIRKPKADSQTAIRQANSSFMPPLSGDGGDAELDRPETWFSILPGQYRNFEKWRDGDYEPGEEEKFPSLEEIRKPEDQVVALQRAALEPCAGGAFHPGIEMTYIAADPALYAAAFRINSEKYKAGDITKHMAMPWQADFYACKDNWWPAARPDDVVSEEVFEKANKAWRRGQLPVSEGLEGRVKWARGLGVTTLFRRPWQNPATAVDDPRASDQRGCDDMVRYWSELGFVMPRETAWSAANDQREIVHVEMERRPYAGMDVRELFHALLNMEEHRKALPKIQEFVELVLAAARQVQLGENAYQFMDNIAPFPYDEATFDQRMQDIYDDCADFAFTEKSEQSGKREPYDAENPEHNPYFRTREQVTERIRQLTPFNFCDGAWLRNIHRMGPMDEVNSILFAIFNEELGDGVVAQNHANIYRDLCHSFGFYPAQVASTGFARDPNFLDAAFDSAAFQLAISEFSVRYYPEIIGMTLWLEWTVLELHRIAAIVERVGLNSHFYRMHIAIDNASSGHAAGIFKAVKLYLRQVRMDGGDPAVQIHWQRMWNGYVAFAYTFVILIKQVIKVNTEPPPLRERLERLIRQKQPYAQHNHGRIKLGKTRTEINAWFNDPEGFLDALISEGYIVPGQPDQSKFFKLLEFRGGRMYHVFSEEEIKLWHDWTVEEAGKKKSERKARDFHALKDRIAAIEPGLASLLSDDDIRGLQRAAADHRIVLWLEAAHREAISTASAAGMTTDAVPELTSKGLRSRLRRWLAWGMVRAATHIAGHRSRTLEEKLFNLTHPETKESRTVVEWLDQIRESSDPARPALAFLQALAGTLQQSDGPAKKLTSRFNDSTTPFGRALNHVIPGNDGCEARETIREWVANGYPMPELSEGRLRPLRLDATLHEEERHPTGVTLGFGTVH
jgi:L-Lysine epsilon oxidase N-terminal/L-lysine epsilon oxidase C-terminal domain/Iron-containing redox enzyme